MRERRKEPREGSEIDPETACIQTVGALLKAPYSSLLAEHIHVRDPTKDRGEVSEIAPHFIGEMRAL